MKKNTLTPDLDLLFRTLCQKVLNDEDFQSLNPHDFQQISTFLIEFNPDISSSRESLIKSLQNWFSEKNTPSISKLEDLSKSLGYTSYHDFTQHNKRRIQANQWRRSVSLSPFRKTLLICGITLIVVLSLPLLTGSELEVKDLAENKGNELLPSVIQAIVVLLFYLLTRFSDFGGRDQFVSVPSNRPQEVNRSMQQFFQGWKFLWLSFSMLYLWFCFIYGMEIHANAYAQSVSDIISVISALCFAYLFSVMDVKSIKRSDPDESLKTFHTYLIIFTIGLSFCAALSILDRYYYLGFLDKTGTYLLGYANVIVMLYFFGRLESHYLNVNRFVLLPLYTYAIIQMAYVLFFAVQQDVQSYAAYFIGMALILKGFLYFLIRDWIKEGKIEHYFRQQDAKYVR